MNPIERALHDMTSLIDGDPSTAGGTKDELSRSAEAFRLELARLLGAPSAAPSSIRFRDGLFDQVERELPDLDCRLAGVLRNVDEMLQRWKKTGQRPI